MKRVRYCGMTLTPEAMAMLGMIGADEYLRLSDEAGHPEEVREKMREAYMRNLSRGWHRRQDAQ